MLALSPDLVDDDGQPPVEGTRNPNLAGEFCFFGFSFLVLLKQKYLSNARHAGRRYTHENIDPCGAGGRPQQPPLNIKTGRRLTPRVSYKLF
jgi:hypothetical protein